MSEAATTSIDALDEVASEPAAEAAAQPAKQRNIQLGSDHIKVIPKDKIKMAKLDPGKRTFSKEFAQKLAESIESDGLLKAPIVQDNGDDTYTVADGRHRVYACCKILGWSEVPCVTFAAGDDDLAESVELAANLWVNPLNEPQARGAIERWYQIYTKRKGTTKTARGTERKRDGFASEVKDTLGVSASQADRIATTAKLISADDRETLEKAGIKQHQIDKIAQLRDPDAVNTAVKLAAAGMAPEEAIRQGKTEKKKAAKAKEKAAKPKGDKAATEKPDPAPKAKDMTDDQWLETHCGKLLGLLVFKAAFKRDAILYRRISEKLVAFRTGTKKALAEAKHAGENGNFFANIYRIARASHPMNWLICDGCDGHGHVKDDKSKQCPKCLGGAYKLKFEET
jgi:hypothetical protein